MSLSLRSRTTRLLAAGLTAAAALGLALTAPAGAAVEPPPYSGEPLDGRITVVAHRGASSYVPEHTFPANDLAIEMDADMLECDVMLTEDEQLVCLHDTTIDRTARDPETGERLTGSVDSYTLAELRAMDWGLWKGEEFAGATIMPLAEQLMCYRAINPDIRFHLETKPSSPVGDQLLVDLLDRLGFIHEGAQPDPQHDQVMIQSFHADSLRRIKAIEPSLATAYLGVTFPEGTIVPDTYDAVAPNYKQILEDPAFVGRMHEQGIPVHTWTVDDRAVMDTLIGYGVDGIFSNKPDVARAAVDEAGLGIPASERGNPDAFAHGCEGIAGTVHSIDDVPITPAAIVGDAPGIVQPGRTVPVPFELDLRGGDDAGAVQAEVTRPDGSVIAAEIRGGNILVHTAQALPGTYTIEVQDEVGFAIGEGTITTR
ncbi:hypothetical protein A7J15_01760 [Microbacterium sediminis]|uniref:Uncharacterized protein n=1 Tax=Microbacterium sediminis TaxID=904291 RepID=A0A1B9NGR6_9MICO|nr:hypothetical protein A7J15_01760 [Microbacterium sediminis]QBR74188.1 hypothetical protein E3O41_07015 [Microbacterium sediminis]